ncbi:MAG: hypothetical protein OES32_09965 [Acidobacteriota bacterium]|nr:hypothetical protein [Acidobacteriota bacterium]MDH3523898.1 hypothetical protein [Acidobacteriota bacterium]
MRITRGIGSCGFALEHELVRAVGDAAGSTRRAGTNEAWKRVRARRPGL